MEIFNAVKTQHAQPPTAKGAETSVQNTRNDAKLSQQQATEKAEEKKDTEKLKKELQEIVEKLNKEMDPLKTSIRFGFNDQVDELYVSVIDTTNNEVIRKIPSDEAMRLAAKMRELVGMIFDKKG